MLQTPEGSDEGRSPRQGAAASWGQECQPGPALLWEAHQGPPVQHRGAPPQTINSTAFAYVTTFCPVSLDGSLNRCLLYLIDRPQRCRGVLGLIDDQDLHSVTDVDACNLPDCNTRKIRGEGICSGSSHHSELLHRAKDASDHHADVTHHQGGNGSGWRSGTPSQLIALLFSGLFLRSFSLKTVSLCWLEPWRAMSCWHFHCCHHPDSFQAVLISQSLEQTEKMLCSGF